MLRTQTRLTVAASNKRATRPASRMFVSAEKGKLPVDMKSGTPKDNPAYGDRGITPSDTARLATEIGKGQFQAAKEDLKAQVDESLNPRVDQLKEANSKEHGYTTAQDAFVFSGPAPELINGRLAMLGFTAAIAAEVFTGKNVFEQFSMAPWAIAGTFAAIIVATLVPLFGGTDQLENSIFKQKTEIINGRAAMLGFSLLVFYELFSGHALFGR